MVNTNLKQDELHTLTFIESGLLMIASLVCRKTATGIEINLMNRTLKRIKGIMFFKNDNIKAKLDFDLNIGENIWYDLENKDNRDFKFESITIPEIINLSLHTISLLNKFARDKYKSYLNQGYHDYQDNKLYSWESIC